MREFDALCLRPVVELAAEQISALRLREHVSQPVFARYLNVSKSSISQWESGAKKPNGAALKLLNIVQSKGLKGFRRPLVFRGKPTIPRQLSPFAVPSVKKPRFE